MIAANLIIATKSHPTRGIQDNSLIIGENNKKWPTIFKIQANIREQDAIY